MMIEALRVLRESAEGRTYLQVHGRRLEYVVSRVERLLEGRAPGSARVLDVGPHLLTELLRARTPAVVNQLGFANAAARLRPGERHFDLDLNVLLDRGAWPEIPGHDVVLACEVIEHLHVPPSVVLGFLRTCLVPGGHLVVQTPNAVALKRRVVMLAGRNPYERLRESTDNPGHFREYTRAELEAYARGAGLDLVEVDCRSYFDYRSAGLAGRAYGAVARLLPPGLRDGITMVLRRGA